MLKISESAAMNITTMLLSHKKITEKQVDQIQTLSKESGQGMIEVLLDKQFVTETDIVNIIAKSYDLPRVKITHHTLPHLFLLKILTKYEDRRSQ